MHPWVLCYGGEVRDRPLVQEIIKKQIELHANYSMKTEYSKEKYKKRKEAKYVQCSWRYRCL